MSVRPYYHLTIGDHTLEDLGIEYLIKRITFVEEIGKFDTVEMVIRDGDELIEAYDLCKHGTVLQLAMGYYNQLVLPMTVCFLKGVQPDFSSREVTLKFYGYLKAFGIGQKSRVLSNRTIKDIVTEVVADYPLFIVGMVDNGDVVLSDTTSQSGQTDLDLLEDIASKFGMYWKVLPTDQPGIWSLSLIKIDFDGTRSKNLLPIYCYPPKEAQTPTKGLWLTKFSPESNILEATSSVSIISNNPNHPVAVNSKLYNSSEYPTEVTGSQVIASVLGAVTMVQFHENVSNDEAAQIIADQIQQDNELKFVSARGCELSNGHPRVRVGQIRRIIPRGIRLFSDIFEGDYVVTRTEHTVEEGNGYVTIFDGSRSKLTVPPPPKKAVGGGVGGSGGPPVILKVLMNSDGSGISMLRGNYVTNFRPLQYGAEISEVEIRANSYWMNHIYAKLVTYMPGILVYGGAVSGQNGEGMGDEGSVSIAAPYQDDLTMINFTTSIANRQAIQGWIEIPVDWPTDWASDGALGVPITPSSLQVHLPFGLQRFVNEKAGAVPTGHAVPGQSANGQGVATPTYISPASSPANAEGWLEVLENDDMNVDSLVRSISSINSDSLQNSINRLLPSN